MELACPDHQLRLGEPMLLLEHVAHDLVVPARPVARGDIIGAALDDLVPNAASLAVEQLAEIEPPILRCPPE